MIIANFSNDYKKIGMEDASEWTDAMSPVGPCCMTLAPWGWKILVKRGMECDYSWGKSANEYIKLYKDLLKG